MYVQMQDQWSGGALWEGSSWNVYKGSHHHASCAWSIGENANATLKPRRYKPGYLLLKVSLLEALDLFIFDWPQVKYVKKPKSWGKKR